MNPDQKQSATPPQLPTPAAPPRPAARPGTAPLSILSADGDAVVQRILRTSFERRGWFVVQAADGREALELMDAESFDLFVLELNLAFINGFELLDALRKRPANRPARTVVVSAQTQPAPVLRAFELGADDFVEKPLIPEILIARIDRLFKPARA